MAEFKKGDIVNIINFSSYKFIIEGQAKIVSLGENNRHRVVFEGDNISVPRYIDPKAQENPTEYVNYLNEK